MEKTSSKKGFLNFLQEVRTMTKEIFLRNVIMSYIFIVNIFAFLICGIDKYCAKKGFFRVPEKFLFFISAIGGALGFYLGMGVFRHKTKKAKFKVGIPAIIIFWFIVILFVICNAN